MPVLDEIPFIWKDKIIHFAAYFVYGSLAAFALFPHNFNKKKIILIVIIWGTAFGASDEIHQYFVPGRYCESADLAADFLGTAFSSLFIKYYEKIYNHYQK